MGMDHDHRMIDRQPREDGAPAIHAALGHAFGDLEDYGFSTSPSGRFEGRQHQAETGTRSSAAQFRGLIDLFLRRRKLDVGHPRAGRRAKHDSAIPPEPLQPGKRTTIQGEPELKGPRTALRLGFLTPSGEGHSLGWQLDDRTTLEAREPSTRRGGDRDPRRLTLGSKHPQRKRQCPQRSLGIGGQNDPAGPSQHGCSS